MKIATLVLCLAALAAKPTTRVPPMSAADADRYVASLPEDARREFADAERYRRARLAELDKEMSALRQELARYRPHAPPGARPRADVDRDLQHRRDARNAIVDNDQFTPRPLTSPIQPGHVGTFTSARIRRITGPRTMLVTATDPHGNTDTLLLTGPPTANLTPDNPIDLPGVYRITRATTPKGAPIPQATRARDLENVPEEVLQAVARLVDRTTAK